jgi:hypothetical protein
MNRKIALAGLFYYVVLTTLFFIFPKQTIGNVYFMGFYLITCIGFLGFIFYRRSKK